MVLMGCMNKMTFASYKFKPCDVIEGLNRYFAESKANRYLRVPLEIKNGEVKPGNYYVIRNIVFDVSTPKIKEYGYYYLICDPEEVVGVAINWLREEHDIFYTPGMEAPIEDFDIDEASKEYEKATRRDLIEALQRRLYEAKRRIAEKDTRIKGLEADISLSKQLVKEQRAFITKVAVLLETKDPYIESEYAHAIDVLSNIVKYPNRYRWLYMNLKEGMESVLQEAEERED